MISSFRSIELLLKRGEIKNFVKASLPNEIEFMDRISQFREVTEDNIKIFLRAQALKELS